MNRYYGYIRVSTAKQGERSVSLPEQRDAIARYAARANLQIVEWFEERQTAAKKGRPVWAQMLRSLRQGKARGVLIHKIDRSARNLKDWADLGELIDQGIEVHFANESLDLHSRGGRLSADIQAVVAADYVRNLREEAKKGIYGRLKQGFYPMRAPIGYLDQGAGKTKTIDPVKGPLIRKAFELYATRTFTLHTLRDEMERLGLRNINGLPMTVNGLSKVLGNPFYTGLIRMKKTGETYQGNHEPLIGTKLFAKVQDVSQGRFHSRAKHHEHLFRRLIRCAACGYRLIGETQKGYVYYRCHTRTCPTNTIKEDTAEVVVREKLKALQLSDAEKACLADEIKDLKARWIEEKEAATNNLRIRIEQITERLRRATDAYLDGTLEKELFEERKQALLVERQTAQGTLDEFAQNRVTVPELLEQFLERAGSAYSLYETAEPEEKRRMVKILSSNVALRAGTLEFAYANPFGVVAEREKSEAGGTPSEIARTWKMILPRLIEQFRTGAVPES